MTAPGEAAYPAHWEADVVLSDGGTAHLRPITPEDAELLVAFYERVSDRSKYLRFFAPYPQLSRRDIERFTQVDHRDRSALIVMIGDQMIAVGRFERLDGDDAEVAFLVEDGHHGRGVGSVLLEHLAQIARERGIARFTAEILPANRAMIGVFTDAGYTVRNQLADGVVHVDFAIRPTDSSLQVTASREQRAEARSIERLLRPESIAVVGASRTPGTVGHALVRNLVVSGFTGPVYAVNPGSRAVAGVPAHPSVAAVPGPIDLAIVAVPAERVETVVLECARAGVKGLVVVSAGFAETDAEGAARQRALVRVARANGMRVVGPNCLGIANTDPAFQLNATLAPVLPDRGSVGLFSQSGALGPVVLGDAATRGLGLSTFVSAGNRADVSGNDLLQYWQDDPATEVVLLYLESIGNPRKFARVARRVSASKPVVVVRGGSPAQGVPRGHAVQPLAVPAAAVEAMFRQSGVIRVETTAEMFDVAQVLAHQPLPSGSRAVVVGNSAAVCLLAADALAAAGLWLGGDPVDLGPGAGPDAFGQAVAAAVADDAVDVVLVVFAPLMPTDGTLVARALAEAAAPGGTTVVTTFLGQRGVPAALRRDDEHGVPVRGSIPSFAAPEEAARALGRVSDYAAWRRRPRGVVPDLDRVDRAGARRLVQAWRAEHPQGTVLDRSGAAQLLACYGVDVLPGVEVRSRAEARDALRAVGGTVVLKATADHLRGRPDQSDVWRNIADATEMDEAWTGMTGSLADAAEGGFVVQPMAPPGVPVVITAQEDRRFGPALSFGISGIATELLADRAYRIPPLTDVDAADMVREIGAAPLLLGSNGAPPVDLGAVQELLHRVSRLVDDLPGTVELRLAPVLVAEEGATVLDAGVRVGPAPPPREHYTRRLA